MDPDTRLRRAWRRWWIALAVVVVVIAGVGALVVTRSDVVHVSYQTAAASAKPLDLAQPAAGIGQLWTQQGVPPASGTASTQATVLTGDQHGVTGRDVRTGKKRWSYQRSNTDLCSWIVLPTVTVATFHNGTDCSDITGFDSDTGKRKWFLNADLGPLTHTVAAPSILLLADKDRVRAFYEETGGEAWSWHQDGCQIDDLTSGDVGAAILYSCKNGQSNIVVLDSWTGDKKWTTPTPGTDDRLLGASMDIAVLATVSGRPAVLVYDQQGKAEATIHGAGLSNSGDGPRLPGVLSDNALIGYDGRRVISVDLAGLKLAWTAPATGPPAVDGFDVLVPTGPTVTARSSQSGATLWTSTVRPAIGAGTVALSRIGSMVVAVTPYRTTVYGR
jgi:PQQ-like domain